MKAKLTPGPYFLGNDIEAKIAVIRFAMSRGYWICEPYGDTETDHEVEMPITSLLLATGQKHTVADEARSACGWLIEHCSNRYVFGYFKPFDAYGVWPSSWPIWHSEADDDLPIPDDIPKSLLEYWCREDEFRNLE